MQKSKEYLFSLFDIVKNEGQINDKLINYLEVNFPSSSEKVLESLKRGIKKYIFKPSNRIFWTAMGEKNEYLIYPRLYCSCKYFYLRVVIEKERGFCKHILAHIISEALSNYQIIELNDSEFKRILKVIKLKF
jgi:predicted nucleic acid-binding Zn finger protein